MGLGQMAYSHYRSSNSSHTANFVQIRKLVRLDGQMDIETASLLNQSLGWYCEN